MHPIRIGLVGDFDASVTAHQAIPRALALVARNAKLQVSAEWIPTSSIQDNAMLEPFDGIWCVPASPYRNMDGALRAIRFARERLRPFLGTCGGLQHALVEYARNVIGWSDADHAETMAVGGRAVIESLSCSLVETAATVHLRAGTRIARAYGCADASESYHCRYGVNSAYQKALLSGALRISAVDDAGDVRAVELDDHPFFVATLFQPERAALIDRIPPVVRAFVTAATGG